MDFAVSYSFRARSSIAGVRKKERKKKKKSIAKESVLAFRIFGLFRDVYDMFRAVKSLGIGKVKLREIRLERMFDKPINTLGFFPV